MSMHPAPSFASILTLPDGTSLTLTRPLVMGIVNVTPDSFSDGGRFLDSVEAYQHALHLVQEGADLLDIGGESTRPDATPVTSEEELNRILPVLQALTPHISIPVSIDTSKASVAQAALKAGASIVNDVWGLQQDPAMAPLIADTGAVVILMHNRQEEDPMCDIIEDVLHGFHRSLELADKAGIPSHKIILDPGFGFKKTTAQNFDLIRGLPRLGTLGYPLLIGVSRKRAIGFATQRILPQERLIGSLTAGLLALERGVHILRVHDVAPHVEALKLRSHIVA